MRKKKVHLKSRYGPPFEPKLPGVIPSEGGAIAETAHSGEDAAVRAEEEAARPTSSPYLDDGVFRKLPQSLARVLALVTKAEGRSLGEALMAANDEERTRLEALARAFRDCMDVTVRWQGPPPDPFERHIFVEPGGDLCLGYADDDWKVRAKCWDFFFLLRRRRPMQANSDADLRDALASVLRFPIEGSSQAKLETESLAAFAPDEGAAAFDYRVALGGFCDGRFEQAQAFADGKVIVARFTPRVARGQDLPPPKGTLTARELVDALKERRRRL